MTDSIMGQRAISHWIARIERDEKRNRNRYPKSKPIMSDTMEGRAWLARNKKLKPVSCRVSGHPS